MHEHHECVRRASFSLIDTGTFCATPNIEESAGVDAEKSAVVVRHSSPGMPRQKGGLQIQR